MPDIFDPENPNPYEDWYHVIVVNNNPNISLRSMVIDRAYGPFKGFEATRPLVRKLMVNYGTYDVTIITTLAVSSNIDDRPHFVNELRHLGQDD